MDFDNIINKLYMFKRLKSEVNSEIENNLDKVEIDELEKFEFMHKVKKLDLIINNVIAELKEYKEEEHSVEIDKEEIVNKFKVKEKEEETLKENELDEDIKQYTKIREQKKNEEKEIVTIKKEIIEEKKETDQMKSSIEMAYKRIEDLEKLLNERRFIDKKELFGEMKDIHSKEEREAMLKKRDIISESFTPKAKEQSDPTMEKTVAMSKDEFYKEINQSLEDEKKESRKEQIKKIDKTEFNIDYTVLMDKEEIEQHSIKNEDIEDEYYDIYNEEKSSGILEKFKGFLGK